MYEDDRIRHKNAKYGNNFNSKESYDAALMFAANMIKEVRGDQARVYVDSEISKAGEHSFKGHYLRLLAQYL